MVDKIIKKIDLLNTQKNNAELLNEINTLCEIYSKEQYDNLVSLYATVPLEKFLNDFFCTKIIVDNLDNEENVFEAISEAFNVEQYNICFDISNDIYFLAKRYKKIWFRDIFDKRKDQNNIEDFLNLVDLISEKQLNLYAGNTNFIDFIFEGSIKANETLKSKNIQFFYSDSRTAKEKQLRYISNILSLDIEHNLIKKHCHFFYYLLEKLYRQYAPFLAKDRYEIIECIAVVFRYAANTICPLAFMDKKDVKINSPYLFSQDDCCIEKQVQETKYHLSVMEDILAQRKAEKFDRRKNILYIYKGNIACIRNKHNIISATAKITNALGNEITLNIEYCRNCKKFLLEYTLYLEYKKKYGSLIGNLRMINSGEFSGEYDLALESPLHLSGYNVGSTNELSSFERKYILESMLYNKTMTKNEIIRYLAYFIKVNGAKKENGNALKKWREDLDFVQNIDLEKQPQYYIDSIEEY